MEITSKLWSSTGESGYSVFRIMSNIILLVVYRNLTSIVKGRMVCIAFETRAVSKYSVAMDTILRSK